MRSREDRSWVEIVVPLVLAGAIAVGINYCDGDRQQECRDRGGQVVTRHGELTSGCIEPNGER